MNQTRSQQRPLKQKLTACPTLGEGGSVPPSSGRSVEENKSLMQMQVERATSAVQKEAAHPFSSEAPGLKLADDQSRGL